VSSRRCAPAAPRPPAPCMCRGLPAASAAVKRASRRRGGVRARVAATWSCSTSRRRPGDDSTAPTIAYGASPGPPAPRRRSRLPLAAPLGSAPPLDAATRNCSLAASRTPCCGFLEEVPFRTYRRTIATERRPGCSMMPRSLFTLPRICRCGRHRGGRTSVSPGFGRRLALASRPQRHGPWATYGPLPRPKSASYGQFLSRKL